MYRGTTPTITINCDIDVSEFVTMWVTFRTQQLATYAPPKQVEVTKHLGDEGVDATDKVVTVSLTQADTLLLRQILKEIEAYIKPLGLRLNGKTQILPLKNGIDFLGFHTYLTQTGKVVRKVRAKSIDNMKRKIRKFRGLVDSGKMTLDSVVQSYASWTGHISHGNTYHLRQNMDAYFFSYFPELKPSPKGDTTHGPKTEQPRKQVEGQVRQPVRQPDRLDRGR
jgi:hypothetical protein